MNGSMTAMRSRSIIFSYAVLGVGHIIGKSLAFLGALIIARALGPGATGIFGTVITFLMYGWVLADSGAGTIGTRMLASGYTDAGEIARRVTATRLLGSAVACVIGAFAIATLHGSWSWLPPLGVASVAYALRFDWILLGQQRMPSIAAASVLREGAFCVLAAIVVSRTGSVTAAAWCFALAELTWSVTTGLLSRVRLSRPGAEAREATSANFLREGWPIAVFALMTLTYNKLDTPLIAWMRSVSEAGVYWAAYALLFGAMGFSAALGRAAFPEMARSGERPHPADIQKTLRLTMLGSLLGCLGAVLMFQFAENLMHLAYGARFAAGAAPLKILSWCLWPNFISTLLLGRLVAEGRQRRLAAGAVLAATTNVVINLLSIPRFGAEGAAIASVGSELCLAGVAIVAYAGVLGMRQFLVTQLWLGGAAAVAIAVSGMGSEQVVRGAVTICVFLLLSAPVLTAGAGGKGLLALPRPREANAVGA
jgi:O-antigen/teichoic acid export membrane protein